MGVPITGTPFLFLPGYAVFVINETVFVKVCFREASGLIKNVIAIAF